MAKGRNISKRMVIAGALGLGIFATAINVTLAAFSSTIKTKDEDNVGKVGILSYFHCGVGSKTDPFVITRPRHFYNLMKLQNIGAFSSGSYYFQIGYAIVTGDTNLYVYSSDTATASDTGYYTNVLDMSGYTSGNKIIHTIGNHAYPFRSTIDGKEIIIKNLTVQSDPDDVGLFGYVSYEGAISNIVLDTTKIISNGYASSIATVYTSKYNDSAVYNVPDGDPVAYTTSDQTDDSESRSALSSLDSTKLTDTTFGTTTITLPTTATDSSGNTATLPTDTTYSVTTSNNVISAAIDPNNSNQYIITVHASLLGTTYSTFFSKEKNALICRAYVLANNTVDGLPVSRTIASYEMYIENVANNDDESGTHAMLLDFIKDQYDTTNDAYTQYHHGQNVGIVIGHLDGKAEEIYAYDSTVTVNGTDTTRTTSEYESTYGLVGEAGSHVDNNLNPNESKIGDVGYLDLDEVYYNIRNDSSTTLYSSSTGTTDTNGNVKRSNYIAYKPLTYDQSTSASSPNYKVKEGSLYQNIVKTGNTTDTLSDGTTTYQYGSTSTTSYIESNSVKFHGKSIIKGRSDDGTTAYDNGLGIFSLVTHNGDINDGSTGTPNSSSSIFTLDTGNNTTTTSNKCRLLYVTGGVKDPTQQTDVNYYPFCNYVSYENRSDLSPAWPRSYGGKDETPTDADWSEKSRQSKNYLFEMTVDSSSGLDRYFHNTKYTYLQKELTNTLLDSTGTPVKVGDDLFGITLRKTTKSGSTSSEVDVTGFSKYWNTTARRRIEFYDSTFTNKVSWSTIRNCIVNGNDGNGSTIYDSTKKYYPFGEISFTLNRPCNMTLVYPYMGNYSGTNKGGDGGAGYSPYITITKTDLAIKNPYGGTRFPYAASPIPNTSEYSNLYYYPENVDGSAAPQGTAAVKWDPSTDGTPIFVHTFQLEKGDYFMSNNAWSYSQPFFYIAVEGQSAGRLSNVTNYTLSDDYLTNVDFLVLSPSSTSNIAMTLWVSDTDRKNWLSIYRCWVVANFSFSANESSLRFTGKTVTIDDASVAILAVSFSKDTTDGLTMIATTNYGTTDDAGFVKKYVVFCNTDADLTNYASPSLDVVISYEQ